MANSQLKRQPVSATSHACAADLLIIRPLGCAASGAAAPLARPAAGDATAMLERYSRPEMARIWSAETRHRIWFEIEAHAATAMAELGLIPPAAARTIWDKGGKATLSATRIAEIEQEVKHDVIAFLTHLAEHIGPEARFLHLGLTSSDVLDTAFNVQLVRAADLLLAGLEQLLAVLKRRAFEHKLTPTVGRSHGIHAEPTTFGVKLAYAYAELARGRERLVRARAEVATCAISGAVGTFANVDPRIEVYVAAQLGLRPEPVSTQVIPRDRHAMYFATLAVIASSLERLATEIRHLQRTEVLEAEEYFAAGQKGSSAMPHKRNPVLSENITGLARMVRSYAYPALENVALWHERDISHSSVERVIGPDATVTLDFALARASGLIDKLIIYPEAMRRNLERLGGLIHSQRLLIALTQKGMSREDAYRLVQTNAMRAWQGEGEFLALITADPAIAAAMPAHEIAALFDLTYHLKHVDTIFARVFAPAGAA
jgi:adenylosuccinate lyase